jgi:ferrochelatase
VTETSYDALLVLFYGGPEGPEDVLPFLDGVLEGKSVPAARKHEVALRYQRFGGVSPLNPHVRALRDELLRELNTAELSWPIYVASRYWTPRIADTLRQMASDRVHHALALFTSAFTCYASCGQYFAAFEEAQREIGVDAPRVTKLRAYFNHPGFVEAWSEQVQAVFESLAAEERSQSFVLFTAHSIPIAMAETCSYREQLMEASRLVAERLDLAENRWQLAFQSRSGPPQQPWLEPGLNVVLHGLGRKTPAALVVMVPIGFVLDNMEVAYDLDVEAREIAARVGLRTARAATPGTQRRFVQMVRELVQERLHAPCVPPTLGKLGPAPDCCRRDCCP